MVEYRARSSDYVPGQLCLQGLGFRGSYAIDESYIIMMLEQQLGGIFVLWVSRFPASNVL